MAEYATMIVETKNQKYEQIIDMHKAKKKIEDKIDMLEQPYKNILYYKYIKGKSLKDVAGIINNEYKYTCTLHGEALVQYKNLKDYKEHDKKG